MYDLPRVCYNPAKGVCTWYQLKAESHVNICYYVVQYEHDYTGWFRLNAKNCVPGNSSRRFFELDHEILHTYSGRHYLKLEEGGFQIFCLGGRLFGVPAGVLDPGGGQNPDISTAKPQIKKTPSSSFRYCLPEYVCKISWSNSKKRREEIAKRALKYKKVCVPP